MGFQKGHKFNNRKGKKLTDEHKQKIGVAVRGSNNGQWKGDDVGYNKLHQWIRDRLDKTDVCPCCEEKPVFDIACYTGIYNRDIDNYVYLCRSCHTKLDYSVGDRIPRRKS